MTRFSVMIVDNSKWLVGRDGGYHERFERVTEATNEAEALNIFTTVYGGNYEVQPHTLRNIGEYANRDEWWEAEYKAKEEAEAKKKAEAKARKEAKEEAEAEAMGMTVETYREKKKIETRIRKVNREIEVLQAEIARKEAYITKLKENLAKI